VKPNFDIDLVVIDGVASTVCERVVSDKPFCSLVEFSTAQSTGFPALLLVAPLSGHYAVLLTDMIIGLLPRFRVYVTDWTNASEVPVSAGPFGLERNIDYVLDFIGVAGEGAHVVALCQGGVPALAAAAMLAAQQRESDIGSLTLIGGPIDPMVNPTRVVNLLRERDIPWFEDNVLRRVSSSFPGYGRSVYPGYLQLASLMAYLNRHLMQQGELSYKIYSDDGLDPVGHSFFTLFTSVMDLPGEFFLDNIAAVFHGRDICCRSLSWHGETVDPGRITTIPLMTIEGEDDDIAAPGQTSAAHGLCPLIPESARRRLLVAKCGHFSLFHGSKWRSEILPELIRFLESHGPGSDTDKGNNRRTDFS